MNAPLDIFRFRTLPTKQAPESVDAAAGVIRGVSVMQAVEALGHNMLIDATTLQQVAELGNAAKGNGVKVRFGHPGACDNALGKMVGHTTNFRVAGDKVLADFTASKSASISPSGNLSAYVFAAAQEHPEQFGMSVVIKAARAWKLQGGGEAVTPTRPDNAIGDLPFARVKELSAVDFVDEPAANRDGLFSDADLVAAFSSTTNADAENAFAALDDIRDRMGLSVIDVARFFQRYLTARNPEPTTLPTGPTMTMKLSAVTILALAAAFPAQIADIDRLANAGEDEASIRAKLGEANHTALLAKHDELKVALAAANTAHEKTKTELSALQTKYTALSTLAGGTPKDVGGTPADKSLDGMTGETLWKAQFASSSEIQSRFAFGGLEGYIAFKKHEKPAK